MLALISGGSLFESVLYLSPSKTLTPLVVVEKIIVLFCKAAIDITGEYALKHLVACCRIIPFKCLIISL